MDTITMKLDRMFRGFKEDSYPGEYLDFTLRENPDLGQLEEIGAVLASYSCYWNDKDVTIFNNDQRMRIFSHLAGYAEQSAAIAAVLSVLSEADGESKEPFFKEEKRRKQTEKYLLLAKSATEADSAIGAVTIKPELLDDYRELLLSFLGKADPYKDERSLYKLASLPKKERERLKSRVVTALSKLLDSNATPASSTYKVLSQRFTDREIRYLNLRWFQGTDTVLDKVIAQFLESLLIREGSMSVNEWEERLFRQYGADEFIRNIQGSRKPYDYLCREYLLRGRPAVLRDEKSWMVAYELYCTEDITEDKSFLKFNPLKKENFGRMACIKSKERQVKLINDFTPKGKQAHGRVIPDYTEEEKACAREMKEISRRLFGDQFMDVLDRYRCYQAMTFLCQTEVIKKPDKVTSWIKQLQGGYGVCCTVEICRQASKVPEWLVQSFDHRDLINRISRKTMQGVPKDVKREYIGLFFDALYRKQPYWYEAALIGMFEEDWKWRNPKEGESTEPEFQLTDFFTEEEIRILVSGLRNSRLTKEEETCINHYRMDKEEYEIWQSGETRKEKEEEDRKALCRIQKEAAGVFESFLKNSCEASYMGRCYWSGRCKEPKLFQSLFEETIAGLAAVRAVEKFKESGEISTLLRDMAKISESKEGIKRFPEMIRILEESVKKGEKDGTC